MDEYLKSLKDNYHRVFQGVGLSYDVVIIGANGFRYASDGGSSYDFDGLSQQLWFERQSETADEIVFISSFLEKFNRANPKESYVFGAIRRVTDHRGRVIGTILLNMDESLLEELYASYGQKSNIYISDSQGNIVSSRDTSLLGKNFIGVGNFRNLYGENETHTIRKMGREFLLSNYYDSQTGWTNVEEMPRSEIMRPLNRLMMILAAVLAVCLAAGGLASYYVAGRVSKPILKLCRSMNQVRHQTLDTK